MMRCLPLLLAVLLSAPLANAGDTPAPARKPGHRDLVLDRDEHDFGTVRQNDVRHTKFTYTNKSDARVTGIHARGECGCNTVAVSHRELGPGESGVLQVEFSTLTLGGHLMKRVRLSSGDHTRGEIVIPLKIAIVEGLIVRPPGVSFGDLVQGAKATKSFAVRWYEGHGEPFEITEVSIPGSEKDFRTSITPYKHEKDPRWKGHRVEIELVSKLPLGPFSREVLVRTTNKDRPRLTLPLFINVCGKIWLQSRTLSFGALRAGQSRSASLKFRPFDDKVKFGKVEAKARSGRITVEVKPDPYMADKGYWKLIASVAPDAAPGSLDDEVIELHTGVPGEEVTLLKVRGYVREAPRRTNDGR